MNYYNPYFSYIPYNIRNTSPNIINRLISNINFKSILSGTQKTLNFVNQLIPAIKQVSPIIKNAKTMFSVLNEFKKVDRKQVDNAKENIMEIKKNNAPTFFI